VSSSISAAGHFIVLNPLRVRGRLDHPGQRLENLLLGTVGAFELMNVDVVVATGTWLLRRSVLISPQAFGDFRQDGDCLIVNLTPRGDR
jgi:hypothetical protein